MFDITISVSRYRTVAPLLLLSGMLTLGLQGQVVWSGDGDPDFSWSNTSNWAGGDDLTGTGPFSLQYGASTALSSVNDIADIDVSGITFLAGAPSYTLSGAEVDIKGIVTNNSSSNQRIEFDMDFSGAQREFRSNSGTTLALAGDILGNGSLYARNSGTVRVEGKISLTGNVGRTDSGTLELLNVENSFGGYIYASYGTLKVHSISDAGVASAIGVGDAIQLGQTYAYSVRTGTLRLTGDAANGSTNRTIRIANGQFSAAGGSQDTYPEGGGAGVIENEVSGAKATFTGDVVTNSTTYKSELTLTGVGDGELSGSIVGNPEMDVFKKGTGTWMLTGENTQQGLTSVEAGTLLVSNPAGSGTGTGNVQVLSGATLGGKGSVTGADAATITLGAGSQLMIGNTHATEIGNTAANGYLGEASNFIIGGNHEVGISLQGDILFDLYGNEAGLTSTEADLLTLATTAPSIILGGKIILSNASGDSTPWSEGTWQIIDWDGVTVADRQGTFTFDFDDVQLEDGFTWFTDNLLSDGTVSIVAIPEPEVTLLLFLALTGAIVRRKKSVH